MYLVKTTDIAEQEIIQALSYMVDNFKSPAAANNHLNIIEEKEKILSETPKIYALVPDKYLGKKGIRFVMIKNYMMFYTINEPDKIVDIIRFLHGSRNWKNILKEEK